MGPSVHIGVNVVGIFRRGTGHWQPIFLLNVDYKTASKAVASRLSKAIDLVVNCDQSCAVPGRLIGDTVSLLFFIFFIF